MDDIYKKLQERADREGIGYPATEKGHELKYLEELYTPEEAAIFVNMKDGYQTTEEAAEFMGTDPARTAEVMYAMSKKGTLFRLREGDTVRYRTIPFLHGIYEFSADHLTATMSVNFTKHFAGGLGARIIKTEEPIFRMIPVNREIVTNKEILPMDDAVAIIRMQESISLTECTCRRAKRYAPKGMCGHSMETCFSFGQFAEYLIENGAARRVTQDEAIEIMKKSDDEGLVVGVLNSQKVETMCACCSCCCGALNAIKFFGRDNAEKSHNNFCVKDESKCINCGKCSTRCPMGAQKMVDGKAVFNLEFCIGCGLCVTKCPKKALTLHQKDADKIYLPVAEYGIDTYDLIARQREEAGEF